VRVARAQSPGSPDRFPPQASLAGCQSTDLRAKNSSLSPCRGAVRTSSLDHRPRPFVYTLPIVACVSSARLRATSAASRLEGAAVRQCLVERGDVVVVAVVVAAVAPKSTRFPAPALPPVRALPSSSLYFLSLIPSCPLSASPATLFILSRLAQV
jgi:hypothetical protein